VQHQPPIDERVVVIGAGRSGLAAARALHKLNVPTMVLEASDRRTRLRRPREPALVRLEHAARGQCRRHRGGRAAGGLDSRRPGRRRDRRGRTGSIDAGQLDDRFLCMSVELEPCRSSALAHHGPIRLGLTRYPVTV
jgi:glycine/D-amino acid oxidase-like deaminating enzyme